MDEELISVHFCSYSYEQNVKHTDVLKRKQNREQGDKTLNHISN